jgi:hypothetical protein
VTRAYLSADYLTMIPPWESTQYLRQSKNSRLQLKLQRTKYNMLLFGTFKNVNWCRYSLTRFKQRAGALERTSWFCSPLIVLFNGCWTAIVKLSNHAGVVARTSQEFSLLLYCCQLFSTQRWWPDLCWDYSCFCCVVRELIVLFTWPGMTGC